jgi:hypothetical protein
MRLDVLFQKVVRKARFLVSAFTLLLSDKFKATDIVIGI